MTKMTIEQAREIARSLEGAAEGWTSADYTTSIDTSGFITLDGCTAKPDWDRIDEFADEVAARAIQEYANRRKRAARPIDVLMSKSG